MFTRSFLTIWERDKYISWAINPSPEFDFWVINSSDNKPEILDFIVEKLITEKEKKTWAIRQEQYTKGIISVVPQDLLADYGLNSPHIKSLLEWNFWGENELEPLFHSFFGKGKEYIAPFILSQVKKYQPEKEFLILAGGLPIGFIKEDPEFNFRNLLNQKKMNVLFKIDKNT